MRKILLVLLFIIPVPAVAQDAEGQKARFRIDDGAPWSEARLVSLVTVHGSDGFVREDVTFRVDGTERVYELMTLDKVQVYKPHPVLPYLLASAAGGALAGVVNFNVDRSITGNQGGDAAVYGAGGLAVGGLILAISPGRWQDWP